MIKEQFEMAKPASENIDEESIKQKEAEGLHNEIIDIQGERSLEDLEVDELKKVLEIYKKIKEIGKGKTELKESKLEGSIKEQIEKAQEMMGEKEVMGPSEIKKAFGIEIKESEVPPIPFNEAELERAKELGQFLVLRVNKAQDGQALNMLKMHEILTEDFSKKGAGKV